MDFLVLSLKALLAAEIIFSAATNNSYLCINIPFIFDYDAKL
jgi:hypothetical protein